MLNEYSILAGTPNERPAVVNITANSLLGQTQRTAITGTAAQGFMLTWLNL